MAAIAEPPFTAAARFLPSTPLPLDPILTNIMGKKGKKAKGAAAAGVPLNDEEKNMDLTLQIETLERELLVKIRIEEVRKRRTAHQECRRPY